MHAESRGNVSHQVVMNVDVAENRTVRSESAMKYCEPTKVRLRSLVCFHTETVVLLREFELLSSSLRLVVLVEDLPTFARVCGSEDLDQH